MIPVSGPSQVIVQVIEGDEVISAILVGLPAAGNGVIQVLPVALTAYDAE